MIDDSTICRMVRTLINSHERNISMTTLLKKFDINKSDTGPVYELINEKLHTFGMELAENQKLLIVKKNNLKNGKNKFNCNEEILEKNNNKHISNKIRELIIIGTIIILEGGKIEKTKFESLKSRINFKFSTNLVRLGYICENKINEDVYVEFGWRFNLEFPMFDPTKILNFYIDE
ncbi:hypothetical protein DMUE_5189 [Dictyocoela muelleri]|nr:hypothetical protein DMUE_5189 [Dictyocoela muelleri]